MKSIFKDISDFIGHNIYTNVPHLINSINIDNELKLVTILTSKSKINNLLCFLRDHHLLQFKSMQDLFAIDLLDYPTFFQSDNKINTRYQVLYYLLSTLHEVHILIKVNVSAVCSIQSASNIFNSAVWLEREIWDLYGVLFLNHPDLRRILTDYGFEGHPLRKDFPLSGYTEILYTSELKKITVKPLELSQEYRFFDFVNPWEYIKK